MSMICSSVLAVWTGWELVWRGSGRRMSREFVTGIIGMLLLRLRSSLLLPRLELGLEVLELFLLLDLESCNFFVQLPSLVLQFFDDFRVTI